MSFRTAKALLLERRGWPLERYIAICMHMTAERCRHIAALDYNDFLQTEYWDIVKKYVMWEANYRCTGCGLFFDQRHLTAHHLSYERHGFEHLYWFADLACVCHRCHERIHNPEARGGWVAARTLFSDALEGLMKWGRVCLP